MREYFCSRCGYFLVATDAELSASGGPASFRTICRSCRKNQLIHVDQAAVSADQARVRRAELRQALRTQPAYAHNSSN